MNQKKEPRRRTVEMEITVGGNKKRIVATNCTIKSPLLSKLGFGKKREVLVCQSVDIIEPEEEKRAFEGGEEIAVEKENDVEAGFSASAEDRAKAHPGPLVSEEPLEGQEPRLLHPRPRRGNAMPEP